MPKLRPSLERKKSSFFVLKRPLDCFRFQYTNLRGFCISSDMKRTRMIILKNWARRSAFWLEKDLTIVIINLRNLISFMLISSGKIRWFINEEILQFFSYNDFNNSLTGMFIFIENSSKSDGNRNLRQTI